MRTFFDELYETGCRHAKHTIWVFSDLQQSNYDRMEKCLLLCMEDYAVLNEPAEMIWYLGDATEGKNLDEIFRITDMQEKTFSRLGIPLCYATGNHDYDYAEYCHRENKTDYRIPFYEMVKKHPGWHTTREPDEFWFRVPLDDYMFYFFSDHVAKDNSWCITHNRARYGGEFYPWKEADFAKVRTDMQECGKSHIITAGHYGFPGGNRDTAMMQMIQPLPANVHLHLYGHSHIGEYHCPKERVFSQIQWIDWQDIPQIDVASFENIRGSYCRSVFLQIYEDDSLGIFFRNHDEHRFVQAFFPKMQSSEIPGEYDIREKLSIGAFEKEYRMNRK